MDQIYHLATIHVVTFWAVSTHEQCQRLVLPPWQVIAHSDESISASKTSWRRSCPSGREREPSQESQIMCQRRSTRSVTNTRKYVHDFS